MIDTGGIDDVYSFHGTNQAPEAEIAGKDRCYRLCRVRGKEGITDADEYVARKL